MKWWMLIVAALLMAACNEPEEVEPEKTEDTMPPIEWEVMEY